MRRPVQYALAAVVAVVALTISAQSGLGTAAFTDFENEAQPAAAALERGELGSFFDHSPSYGPSLLLRAPALLIRGLFEDGPDGLYRTFALPGLIAFGALGLTLFALLIRANRPRAAWLALALCVTSPLIASTLTVGHPEELVGAAFVGGSALAAARGRALLTGVLLGLALVTKQWAVLAVLPILITLPHSRLRALVPAVAIAAVAWLPFLLAGSNAVTESADVGRTAGIIFHPTSIWWFFGSHGEPVYGIYGLKPGYRAGPAWVGAVSHPLVVLVPTTLSLLFVWIRRGRGWTVSDGLLLLAFSLLLRCELDSWNRAYYAIPFLVALLVWEITSRDGLPWVSALATALVSLTQIQGQNLSPDLQSVLYLVWVVPAAAVLAAGLFAPVGVARLAARLGHVVDRRIPQLSRLAMSR